ncbi:Nefa Nip30 N domain-containing protein [Citrus sinensis]|uniref:Nefa Nip30 N domain-containing protein n=1 Tax=Citrus sinensis TaxID=2711 RepID=A0ACB8MN02_CITSI|nr:Nefa Nip30 N domain-containing protein [Citrus sinensis]KAH9787020.1 Nefa Nip30 N domain-containing protein [Citrus sinensis]
MAEESSRPIRLMNFISEEQLDEAKRTRGERVDDGTAQRDRPLFEILKENKDKKDAEFNERFKHRPPKALDEDETEFLEKWETAAVAAQSTIVHELKETPPLPAVQEQKTAGRKNPPTRPLGMIIKVKPQAKKARIDEGSVKEPADIAKAPDVETEKSPDIVRTSNGDTDKSNDVTRTGLVSYSDESDDDDE